MRKCVTMELFRVKMEKLEEDDKRVVISVIENFTCDKVGGVKEKAEIEGKATVVVEEFVDILKMTKGKIFMVIEPMKRPVVKWYREGLP